VGEWRIEKHDNDHTKDNFPNNIINKTSIIMLLKKGKVLCQKKKGKVQ
jgi:hypothetical protein